MNLKELGKIVWEGKRQGIYFPDELKGMTSLETGYKIQLEALSLEIEAGEEQAGWKVGLTSKALQEMFGFNERLIGYLLKSGEVQSPAVLTLEGLENPLFEPELCVIVGETLNGPGVTNEQARAAIAGVAPAVEFVDYRGELKSDQTRAIAYNLAHVKFITGTVTAPVPQEVDLKETKVGIYVNGELRQREDGNAVMAGPEGSVAFFANKLAEFGLGLKAGDKLMTGSFTKTYPANPGDRFEARFDPFGSVLIEVK